MSGCGNRPGYDTAQKYGLSITYKIQTNYTLAITIFPKKNLPEYIIDMEDILATIQHKTCTGIK
jgi:hypothetical protein